MPHLILIYEDGTTNLFVLRTILESGRYDIQAVQGTEPKLQDLARLRPDLIILGYLRGDEGELDFLTELRQSDFGERVPVLLVTTFLSRTLAWVESQQMSHVDVIQKPFGYTDLMSRIEHLLPPGSVKVT
jgi:DNA-binding response OmpR family regulator